MIIFLTVIHVIVCFFLIIVVLLQSGKAADLAGAFGGMGSQTAFGPRGAATVLSKATTASAVIFMVTSLSLAILYTREGGGSGSSVLEKAPAAQTTPAPQVPATQPGSLPAGAPAAPGKNPNEVQVDFSQQAPAAPADAKKDAGKQSAPAPAPAKK
ncbi:MAG: preprotein translocase subunit SecG [Bryobacteraceae bacterium]|nr:preprotein translocase subunit SecG [Bryobacteraceae bacterium]